MTYQLVTVIVERDPPSKINHRPVVNQAKGNNAYQNACSAYFRNTRCINVAVYPLANGLNGAGDETKSGGASCERAAIPQRKK